MEHQAITAAVVAFVSTGSLVLYGHRRNYMRKRRAKRGIDGRRLEVVGELFRLA